MTLPPLSFVVIDTETTGLLPRVHSLLELAFIRIQEGEVVEEYEQLFSIEEDIPPHIQALTHLCPQDLKGKCTFAEHREHIRSSIIFSPLIFGQNVGFDLQMLKSEGCDLTEHPWIDTSMLASLVFPELRSYSLSYLSTALGLRHDPIHRALGDARATLALIERCWERLCMLTPELNTIARNIMQRSTSGYRMLFDVLPAKGTKDPPWLHKEKVMRSPSHIVPLNAVRPVPGRVHLLEEPLDPTFLSRLMQAAELQEGTHWFAVKNLERTLRRLSLPEGATSISFPSLLPDHHAVAAFAQAKQYTADESTLALKIAWYEPESLQGLPIHGNERAIWNGKIACTERSEAYRKQFENLPKTVLIDHWGLLSLLANPSHPAHRTIDARTHMIIDDASMLEDTATKAYGWYCALDDLRAAAEGNNIALRFVDTLQLWIEQVRQCQDTHILREAELRTPQVRGLREQLASVCTQPTVHTQLQTILTNLASFLKCEHIEKRITWIEHRADGAQFLHSVPEHIDTLLSTQLFARFPVTLLIPPGGAGIPPEILSPELPKQVFRGEYFQGLPILIAPRRTPESLFRHPPTEKSIILLQSKHLLEQAFSQFAPKLEKKGTTVLCQGLSGGQNRMQAEFIATQGTVLWLLTPWFYEGVELPPNSVNHLVIGTLPFDRPSHPVFGKRGTHYADSFEQYTLPRTCHRLFRILRNFCQHRTEDGSVEIIDERIAHRQYGVRLQSYLEQFKKEGGERNAGREPLQLKLF